MRKVRLQLPLFLQLRYCRSLKCRSGYRVALSMPSIAELPVVHSLMSYTSVRLAWSLRLVSDEPVAAAWYLPSTPSATATIR